MTGTKNMFLVVILAVLAMLLVGCDATAEQMDEVADNLNVEDIVAWQSERRANGPVCNMFWIKGQLDFSTRLQNLHVCSPEADDAEKHGKMLLNHIQECTEICSNGFVEGSAGCTSCKSQCLGDMSDADMMELAILIK